MEAAGALGRGGLSTILEATREAIRARSRTFWIVAGLTLGAAVLRFSTLGAQAYHHDEIVSASRILRDGFWHAMSAVSFSESAPPLYYALAWVWTQFTGTGEFGLRSLSALAGVATVPVAYLLAVELRGRRAGILAAALAAVNPMLLWYSQEARVYALFAFLTALSALYFVRALDRGERRDLISWGIVSALALATHYFAVFPIAAEALWLLYRRRRETLAGLWIIALVGIALAPLAIHQMSIGHAEWIGDYPLLHRLWEAAVTFTVGETGDVIARPESATPGLFPLALIVGAVALLLLRGERRDRRRAGIALALGAVTVAVPLALALLAPSKDYVLARNLIPALVPLLVAVAIALTMRRARRLGPLIGALLFAYSLGFCIWASISPALQRPEWNSVAARLGEPDGPRAMVTWTLGEAPLRYYLSTGSFQVSPTDGFSWFVREVDFISNGSSSPVPPQLLGPGFRETAYERVDRLYIRRYRVSGAALLPLRLRAVRRAELGFRTNGVLLDGIGPS